jgi:SOS response regulatory protein OraA/RecX
MREQDPVQVAVRALRHRDLSVAALDARLERAGVDAAEREQTLETLGRVGYVDDARFAERRAQSLAERGWGNAGIEADLERQGIDAEGVVAALGTLAPEHERAAAIVAARGAGPKTAAYLTRHGFGDDAVALALVAHDG